MQNFTESLLKKYSEFIEPEALSAFEVLFTNDDLSALENATLTLGSSFGASKEFKLLFSDEKDAVEAKLVKSFHNNLGLLVQKTWVEKSDETVKEQILAKLDSICAKIEEKQYTETYSEILSVLNKVVMLMFGDSATSTEDFAEYAVRIDPGFGTFWCFLQSLPETAEWSNEKIRCTLLLEMCFLANY